MNEFSEFLNEQLQDEDFRKEWDSIQPELDVIRAMIDNRRESTMTLYDVLKTTAYYQDFEVYIENAYDQNILIGNGKREKLIADGNTDVWDHLMDKVTMLRLSKDGKTMVLFVRDENYEKRAEELYRKDYVKTWRDSDRESRPFAYFSEIKVM